MNYELAKELKDAGFPQGDTGRKVGLRSDEAIVPTLEELIEKCGDKFYSLVFAIDNDWRAFSETDQWNTVATADGKTPTEAVARLWLALNATPPVNVFPS